MDILDRLFSRELNRRAGEKAIKIDARIKRRSRQLGKNAVAASTNEPEKSSLFHRLNIYFPWLKLVLLVAFGVIASVDLAGLTISKLNDPYNKVRIAPMSKHIKATRRDLRGKKLAALTFDDGPSPTTTPRLLDVLKEKEVYATFFMLGNMARNNPDIVKRAKEEGHEVASHTMYHQNLPRISADAVAADIGEAKSVFKDILGQSIKYTRPPYGNINGAVRSNVGTPMILWSVDTLDWKNRNPAEILEIAKRQINDGGIILMHDIYDTSVDAVGMVVDELRKNGYEFVTIPELAREKGMNLADGEAYRSF